MPAAVRPSLRVIACCGDMVVVAGLERLTFEVLRSLRGEGATVHCIVNRWENQRIVELATGIGATWSTGYYWYSFGRHLMNPLRLAQYAWDVAMTSLGLLRDSWRVRPTHILIPNITPALRNAPALLLLRLLGVRVILRAANHPDAGRFQAWLWSGVVARVVDRVIANSAFSRDRVVAAGVPAAKVGLVRNRVSTRDVAGDVDAEVVELARRRRTVLVVGQIAPFKGTHHAVDACLQLLAAGVDLQLVIVGRVPAWPPELVDYTAGLQATIAAAARQDRVHFVGERQNIAAIMRASYVLAAPIVQEETFGNVALESTGAGLPPVVFPTGGMVELVDHQRTGFVCRASTVDALVEGLRYFLDDPPARDRASAACLTLHAAADFPYSADAFRRGWLAVFGARATRA